MWVQIHWLHPGEIGFESQVHKRAAVLVSPLHQDIANSKLLLYWIITSLKVVGNQLLF